MPPREPELDHLTRLLGQCLGRIEAQAFDLQETGVGTDDPALADALDDEATTLHELIDSLLVYVADEHADLNATIERALREHLSDLDVPVVVRQRLAPGLPKIACPPADLAIAVQRALVLAIGRLGPGGEVALVTRCEAGTALLELESRGSERDLHLPQRSETLAEFVGGLGGHCRVETDADGTLLLALELPTALAFDES